MLISKLLREGFHLGFLGLIIKIQITMNNEDIFLLAGTSSLDLTKLISVLTPDLTKLVSVLPPVPVFSHVEVLRGAGVVVRNWF